VDIELSNGMTITIETRPNGKVLVELHDGVDAIGASMLHIDDFEEATRNLDNG